VTGTSLLEDLNQLSKRNRELLSVLGEGAGSDPEVSMSADAGRLRAEIVELRRTIAELEANGAASSDKVGAERQKEYDALLEEKSEVIRSLHLKIQELQEQVTISNLPNEQELQAVCEEMERERAQLDLDRRQIEQDRTQLQGDEEALMTQMREMEMSMSRDRAELARQRNELQRLHNDIKHELELAARDASLRDRLEGLQRRHQEINQRKGAAPAADSRAAAPRPQPAPAAIPVKPAKKESGLLRRLFGSGK
jgi:chromosome segregation ATPase